MWAYGSPEVWPEKFIESGTNSDGDTIYSPEDRNFRERLFNPSSFPFFVLFIIFCVLYIFESVVISFISKFIFKEDDLVDENQPPYSEIKEEMSDWTLNSYDPTINLEYRKVINAMLDVAEDSDIQSQLKHEGDAQQQADYELSRKMEADNIYQDHVSEHSDDPIKRDKLPDIHAHLLRNRNFNPEIAEDSENDQKDISDEEQKRNTNSPRENETYAPLEKVDPIEPIEPAMTSPTSEPPKVVNDGSDK